MAESGPRRKLAAILAADVVGFNRMLGEIDDRTLHNLKICTGGTHHRMTGQGGLGAGGVIPKND